MLARMLRRPRARFLFALVAVLLPIPAVTGCTLAKPFSGPGYERGKGVTLPGAGETVVVGLTYAKLDPATRGPFDDNRVRVVEDLARNAGFIGYSIRTRVFGNEVWTMTVWQSHGALDAFVESQAHQRGVREGMPAVTAARFARIELPRREIPLSWDRALEVLEKDGYTRGY
jgi:heme-degrading monooxygenase HmoA